MAFLQFIGTFALIFGLFFGLLAKDSVADRLGDDPRPLWAGDLVVVGLLGVYLLLTIPLLRIRSEKWGASPTQIRAVWFVSFAMGSIGAPVIVWFSSK